ncbi:patatin-like phospholipase family protein [Streptomyces sp. NPDC004838]
MAGHGPDREAPEVFRSTPAQAPASANESDPPDDSPDEDGGEIAGLIARSRALQNRPVPPPPTRRPVRPPLPTAPPPRHRIGLVLAGGAAKGAYQIGAVQRLAEAGVELTAVAGTSIGALNAAVLASAPDLSTGVVRLSEAWEWFTQRFGDGPFGDPDGVDEGFVAQFGNLAPRLVRMLGRRGDLETLVRTAVDPDAVRGGIPCRVAVYPVGVPIPLIFFRLRAAQTAGQFLRRAVGVRSRMVELNTLADQEMLDTVLGSAALPFLFPPRSAGGSYYRDGFLGGDNTPIRALADIDHCDIVIVVHLTPGETVRPKEHKNLTLLQVRPETPLTPSGPLGGVSGPLDFSPARSHVLRRRGYEDTGALMDELDALLRSVANVRHSTGLMAERVQRVLDNSPGRQGDQERE